MKKYIFSILFYCLPLFCFCQTAAEIEIIDEALTEIGGTISIKYFEVRGKNDVLTEEHLKSLINLNKKVEKYYPKGNDLTKDIYNIRFCVHKETRDKHYKTHSSVEEYIDFVFDEYVNTAFKRGGEYDVSQKLKAIKKKAKEKYDQLAPADKSPVKTIESPSEVLIEEVDGKSTSKEDSIRQEMANKTDSLDMKNRIDSLEEVVAGLKATKEKEAEKKRNEDDKNDNKDTVFKSKAFYFLSLIGISLLGVLLFKNRNKLKMKKIDKPLIELKKEQEENEEKKKREVEPTKKKNEKGIKKIKNKKYTKNKKKKGDTKEKEIVVNAEVEHDISEENVAEDQEVKNQDAGGGVDEENLSEKENKEGDLTPPVKSTEQTSVSKFLTVGASVIGKSHIENNLPCQDNHFIKELDYGWTLAVTADGAGSAKRSEIGSKLVSHLSVEKVFVEALEKTDWFEKGGFPKNDNEWGDIAKEGFRKIYDALCKYSLNRDDTALKDLACTVIIAIIRPEGILVSHIGDGRAGYKNSKGEWKSIIDPYRGEEANSTVFITSNIWEENLIDIYMESRVIKEDIKAFTLLSDGCENHAFKCSHIDPETQLWSDPNLPFSGFYEPVIETLLNLKNENISNKEMQERWENFLKNGSEGLKNESDDKTMILGIYQSDEKE